MAPKTKKWYQSKTIWANIIVVVVATLTAIDAQFGTNIMNSPITQAILAVAGAFGIYGRAKANKPIGG